MKEALQAIRDALVQIDTLSEIEQARAAAPPPATEEALREVCAVIADLVALVEAPIEQNAQRNEAAIFAISQAMAEVAQQLAASRQDTGLAELADAVRGLRLNVSVDAPMIPAPVLNQPIVVRPADVVMMPSNGARVTRILFNTSRNGAIESADLVWEDMRTVEGGE